MDIMMAPGPPVEALTVSGVLASTGILIVCRAYSVCAGPGTLLCCKNQIYSALLYRGRLESIILGPPHSRPKQ